MAKFPMKTKSLVFLIVLVFLLYFISLTSSQIVKGIGSGFVALQFYTIALSEENLKNNKLYIIFCIGVGLLTYFII
ncbi:hypothetical protein H9L01_10470 [Erysipelothrix inopinata]|uniref:Uncharacterized protein n=1 Tax=Erysipelothrix inopinata TaxID=225084 RepID=A0A7G9RYU5_9FIRM|nr:hypothetical protein [Erysipelothrix inopinata]QNN60770.1 hypothetical protein H9L01_10470 [Erysipelothrix inopinata]